MTDLRATSEDEKRQAIDRHLSHSQRLVMLGTRSAGVAHELNNILTPVLSYAHLAAMHPDDEALREKAFAKIITGVETACELASAVLDFAMDRDESPVADVGGTLAKALAASGRDLIKDGIRFESHVPDGVHVCMKPLSLQQVLLNLILNARDAILAAGRAGGTIAVAAETRDASVHLVVSDTGPGIEPDVMRTLFEPFVTSHPETAGSSAVSGGCGLGLAVTRFLVERAGGVIDVSSELGHGASFTIVLPRATGERASAA
ncbi:MAG: sensor histidine kinase [Planctomycetota bacterium]|jgi:signal transduction histidine kinase